MYKQFNDHRKKYSSSSFFFYKTNTFRNAHLSDSQEKGNVHRLTNYIYMLSNIRMYILNVTLQTHSCFIIQGKKLQYVFFLLSTVLFICKQLIWAG
jgi:hypothetical protein